MDNEITLMPHEVRTEINDYLRALKELKEKVDQLVTNQELALQRLSKAVLNLTETLLK